MVPQRHTVTDGLWLREGREGRPGLGGATLVALGTPGFSTRTGTVLGAHVAWSGNSSLRVERSPRSRHHARRRRAAAVGRGRARRRGELHAHRGSCSVARTRVSTDSRRPSTPRTLLRRAPGRPARRAQRLGGGVVRPRPHPAPGDRRPRRPGRRRAVRAGRRLVPRSPRRHRRARRLVGRPGRVAGGTDAHRRRTCDHSACSSGSGSSPRWSTPTPSSTAHTPTGSWRPVTGCRSCTATSWSSTSSRPEVWQHVHDQVSAVLSSCPIDYVKWDHNRELLEAGSFARGGSPAVRARADARVLPDAGRPARQLPRHRLGVVRLGRRAHRPERAGADPAGLDAPT